MSDTPIVDGSMIEYTLLGDGKVQVVDVDTARKLERRINLMALFLSSRQCADHNGKWEPGRCFQCELEALERQCAKQQWIPVADRLPQSGVPVIAFVVGAIGNPNATRRIRAEYAAKFTLPVSDECDDGEWGDYSEGDDMYYCPEGWFESNEYEDTHWSVHGTVTHWMPLPDKPSSVEPLEAAK